MDLWLWLVRAGLGLRCVHQWVIPNDAQPWGQSRERGMESSSLLFWRGEKRQEHFALPLLVDEGNLCAPRISQMSLRESWEVRASFSASPARTLASSLSLIFIHVCFPPGNFYQSIQPARLLPVGTGLKLTCPPGSRNGSDCGAWPGRRFRSWRESTWHEAKSYLMMLSCFWSEHTADWRGEQK